MNLNVCFSTWLLNSSWSKKIDTQIPCIEMETQCIRNIYWVLFYFFSHIYSSNTNFQDFQGVGKKIVTALDHIQLQFSFRMLCTYLNFSQNIHSTRIKVYTNTTNIIHIYTHIKAVFILSLVDVEYIALFIVKISVNRKQQQNLE